MAEQSLGNRVKRLRGAARREAISKVLSQFRSSELSAAAFCESTGIATVTLSRWRRELGDASRGKATAPRIVEVRPTTAARPVPFELSLPSGVSLRIPHGFDEADLGRLLAMLNASC